MIFSFNYSVFLSPLIITSVPDFLFAKNSPPSNLIELHWVCIIIASISEPRICIQQMNAGDFPFSNQYDWKNRVQIGQGGFGTVFKVKSLKTGTQVAVKQMDMQKFDADYKKEALKTQIAAMKELKSPYTVNMLDFHFGFDYTYIILQLCTSDLKTELINEGHHFSQDKTIKVFLNILQGFRVLTSKGYIHRDVKPENILTKDNSYKVADYGFSRKVNTDFQKLKEICGTPLYMAPQLLYLKQYTSKCDIWSLGLVFYEMLFGYSPWATRHIEVVRKGVVSKPVGFPYNCEIGINVKDFIERCLQLEESDRISWKEIFQHPLVVTKQKGPPIKHIQVDNFLLKILIRVQESSSRKFINVSEMFKKYEKYEKMDEQKFLQFMREIDPQITSFENYCIFSAADTTQDGWINLNQFKKFYVQVDYRPVEDIGSRRIEEIVNMAYARGLSVEQFFNLFDKDKSSEIDSEQFYAFIRYIAPMIPKHDIELMWKHFDKDKSGKISRSEFVVQFTRGVPEKNKKVFQNFERAARNTLCLRDFLRSKNASAEEVFGKAKIKKGDIMKIEDFEPLIKSINQKISQNQIHDMFRYIDRNNSGTIEVAQIRQVLGY